MASGDKIDKMMQMLCNLTEEVKEMRKEQKDYKEEIMNLKREVDTLNQENRVFKKDYSEVKDELRKANRRIERLEKEKRDLNIVIKGLDIPRVVENMGSVIENFIKEELDVDVTVKAAYRLGKNTCLVELAGKEDKLRVMQNKRKLKARQGEKIFIDNDLTQNEREIGREIRKAAKEERTKGKNVIIKYQKLIVDGIEYKWSTDQKKLMKIPNQEAEAKN